MPVNYVKYYICGVCGMKKALLVSFPVLIVLVLGGIFVFTEFIKPVNLSFTEKITLNYEYAKSIHLEITDKNDYDDLIVLCKGTAINDFSIPSCGFGSVELIFDGNGEKVVLYPACDSCSTMRLGKDDKFFYCISEINRDKLVEILAKYGATFPCI